MDAFYDHESAFEAHIKLLGLRTIAKRAGVELRERNTITPKVNHPPREREIRPDNLGSCSELDSLCKVVWISCRTSQRKIGISSVSFSVAPLFMSALRVVFSHTRKRGHIQTFS